MALLIAAIGALGWIPTRPMPRVSGNAQVIDGDSLRVDGVEIRLHGIDAPELRQICRRGGEPWLCGMDAERALRTAVGTRTVTCRGRDQDRYGRLVATCEADGTDISAHMVRQGHAIADGAYRSEEREARDARRGLWSSSFENPSAWRARHPRPVS